MRLDSETFRHELAGELRSAKSMSSPLGRLAGLCTLVALGAWCYGGLWAAEFMRDRFLMLKASQHLGHNMQLQAASPPALDTEPVDVSDVDDPVGEARRLMGQRNQARLALKAQVVYRKARSEQFARRINAEQAAQIRIGILWAGTVIVAAVFLLGAALAGLTGSPHGRKWHLAAAVWMLLSTAATAGSMWALTRWGGFPPISNPWIVARIVAVQASYAVLILVLLLATLGRRATN